MKYVSTLIYLINKQEGNFSKIINQAGWNKRAGRANFEAMINKQRPKTSKETLAAKYKTEGYSVYHEI